MSSAWEKTGRDAADEDIAGGAEPCATLDEARLRCGAWLRGVKGADVDAAARGYLAGWQAHATGNAPPLDLDAIVKRWRRVGTLDVVRDEDGNLALDDREYGVVARMDCDDPGFVEAAEVLAGASRDVSSLVARVRDLEAKLAAETAAHRSDLRDDAKALDDLVAQVWRAAGETHEPPANTDALLLRVAEKHNDLAGFRRAMLDVCERLDGVRPEPDYDAPAELGAWVCDEIDRRVAAARREGAEAMREACVARAKDHVAALKSEAAEAARGRRSDASRAFSVAASAAESIVDALRALPLPGGEP